MDDDSPAPPGLSDRLKSWNTDYYQFLDVFQRSLMQYGDVFPAMLGDVEVLLRNNATAEALSCLARTKELLALILADQVELVQQHHRFLTNAMQDYRSTANAMREYSLVKGDDGVAAVAEALLAAIDHFTLSPIAHLDTAG
jgi:hypothetical protein